MILIRTGLITTLCVAGLLSTHVRGADEAKSDSKGNKETQGAAATIGGAPISMSELDAVVFRQNSKLASELYSARVKALDEVLLEKALGEEAKAKSKSTSAYVEEMMKTKAKPVVDAEVEKYYNDNKSRFPNKTFEQVAGEIRKYMVSVNEFEVKKELIKELKAKHNFKNLLEPTRVKLEVGANEPAKGPATAKVTIVEYSDFQCPFCSKGATTMKEIAAEYKDKVRIVFRNNALAMHPRAAPAAEAALCAHEQGKFWEMHDKFFADKKLNDEDFKQVATEIGLDVEKFNACYAQGAHKAVVQEQTNGTKDLGVSGAPAFFVNGRLLSGAQPIEKFKEVIDEELERNK